MNTSAVAPPRAFTAEDYASRMARVVEQSVEVGLDGVVVAPGPDLVWLTGYQPTAITERLTMLVLSPGAPPTLLVPALERPDAEAAAAASALEMRDWTDGADPYAAASPLLRDDGQLRDLRRSLGGPPARPPAVRARARASVASASACP